MAMTKFNNWKKVNEGMEGPDAAQQAPEPNVSLNKKLARFMGGATAQARVEDVLAGVADETVVNQIKVAMDLLSSLASQLDDNKKSQFVNIIKTKLNLLNK